MIIALGILLALCVFFVVVFLHELGHFVVARWCGVKVYEFWIGIPPKLFRLFRDKRWTDWTLNWFPLGGFVRLKGEDILSPDSRDTDSLLQVSWWKQISILLAGVTMNFLLAWVIFSLLFYRGTEPLMVHIRELAPQSMFSRVGEWTKLFPIFNTLNDAAKSGIVTVSPGVVLVPLPTSIAEKSGIQKGDILLYINGIPINHPKEVREQLLQLWGSLVFRVMRDSKKFDIIVHSEDGRIGAYVWPNISARYKYPFTTSFRSWFYEVFQQSIFSLKTIWVVISTSLSRTATHEQKQEVASGIGWPVAIGKVFVGFAESGIQLRNLLVLTAMISLSLGVFNLLPFPALDGGRILIILINRSIYLIAPKYKISPQVEQAIHSAGFILLILASIAITWKDIFVR